MGSPHPSPFTPMVFTLTQVRISRFSWVLSLFWAWTLLAVSTDSVLFFYYASVVHSPSNSWKQKYLLNRYLLIDISAYYTLYNQMLSSLALPMSWNSLPFTHQPNFVISFEHSVLLKIVISHDFGIFLKSLASSPDLPQKTIFMLVHTRATMQVVSCNNLY